MRKAQAGNASDPRVQDLREMWTALLACGWPSLAIVPSEPSVPVHRVVEVLQSVAAVARKPIRVLDARPGGTPDAARIVRELSLARAGGPRAVVVVEAAAPEPLVADVLREVSSVLLVVRVGEVDDGALARTLAVVGVSRVVGSVAVSPLD